MNELKSLEANAQKLVDLAIKAGADACDCVVASGQSISVGVRDGNIENSSRSETDNLSLRVFCGKKIASVSSNAMNGLEQLAERAVAMAKVSPEDEFQGLADKELLFPKEEMGALIEKLDLYDTNEPNVEWMEQSALEAEAAGLAVNGVSKSMGAGMGWGKNGFVLATSDGFSGSYERSGISVSASFVAGEGTGMERDYDYDSRVHMSDLKSAEAIGKSAGEKVVKRLNPQQVKSGAYPIIFDRRISASIANILASAVNGTSVVRKTSFLRDKMGEFITSSGINIIDDPHMTRQSGSKVFDGEGTRCDKLKIVENGQLKNWLLDTATARELGLSSNGRAGRGGTGTSPSTSNLYMEAGKQTFEEMIGSVEQGLYITETIGHGINMVTGDYSKGAAGFWIENGNISYPVAEITIAGNLADMFLNMHPADDLEFKYSTNAPTLLIEGMAVGGK